MHTALFPNRVLDAIWDLRPRSYGYASDGHQLGRAYACLEDEGICLLGEGAYSVVAEEPDAGGCVVKITLARQDGYHHFVRWLQSAEVLGLPAEIRRHFPKVYSTKVLPTGVRVTYLERLYRFYSYSWSDPYVPTHETLVIAREHVLHAMPRGLRNDLHSQNVMWRDEDTPVITDPWSHDPSYRRR